MSNHSSGCAAERRSSSPPSASARAARCGPRRWSAARRPAAACRRRSRPARSARVGRRQHLRAGLGEAVGDDDRQSALGGAGEQPRRRRVAADQHGAQVRRRPSTPGARRARGSSIVGTTDASVTRCSSIQRGKACASKAAASATQRRAARQRVRIDSPPTRAIGMHSSQQSSSCQPRLAALASAEASSAPLRQHGAARLAGRARGEDDRGGAGVRHGPTRAAIAVRSARSGAVRLRMDQQRRHAELQQRVERDDGLQRVGPDRPCGAASVAAFRSASSRGAARQRRELGERVGARADPQARRAAGLAGRGEDRQPLGHRVAGRALPSPAAVDPPRAGEVG